jgi:LysR family hydrogen peroxide-inducible transcriptional activator
MELTQLRTFVKIVEQGSFTRAAAACHLSQPALSQQIAKLEAELGCPLLERLGRHVLPTEAGVALLERARRILALVDDTSRQVRDDGVTGRVVLGAIPTVAPYFLPRVLRQFRKHHPEARVEVNELTTDVLTKCCQQGEIDLGVLALPLDVPHLEVERLFEEALWLVVPSGHPLARARSIRIDRLRDEPFVLLDEAHCLSTQIRSFCRSRKFQPIATGKTSQLATVQEMVSLGHGLSFVPEMARRIDMSKQRVYRPIAGEPPKRTIAMCWNGYRYQSKLSCAFRELLRTLQTEALPRGRQG